jgi:hypothetical protein
MRKRGSLSTGRRTSGRCIRGGAASVRLGGGRRHTWYAPFALRQPYSVRLHKPATTISTSRAGSLAAGISGIHRRPGPAALFWISAWLLYPLSGMIFGRVFPRVCTPMDPCPLTAVSIALLAAAVPKVSRALFILLLPWWLLALPKALGMYQCYEDGILFLSGIYGVIVLAANWRTISATIRVPPG